MRVPVAGAIWLHVSLRLRQRSMPVESRALTDLSGVSRNSLFRGEIPQSGLKRKRRLPRPELLALSESAGWPPLPSVRTDKIMKSPLSLSSPPAYWIGIFFAVSSAACGGGGDACAVAPADRLDGAWAVTSSSIAMQTGSYIPIGLDAATMNLQFLASGPDENGGCGVAYSVSVPGLNLTSPSQGNQPLSLGAAGGSSLPADTFLLSGIYYNTVNNVTVDLFIQLPAITNQSGFDQVCSFNIYSGNQVVSLPVPNEPGQFYDGPNPSVPLLASGTMVLSFVDLR